MAWFLQISSFVELFWILQQWKLGDNIVAHLLEHQHTKTLALLHNNQLTRRRSLDERVNDKVGGIIGPEEALAGVRHCAPRKKKFTKLQVTSEQYKFKQKEKRCFIMEKFVKH